MTRDERSVHEKILSINRRQRLERFELFHAYMLGQFSDSVFIGLFQTMLRRYNEERRCARDLAFLNVSEEEKRIEEARS